MDSDLLFLLAHPPEKCSHEQKAAFRAMFEQQAKVIDDEVVAAEASGNLHRMILANKYNGPKIMAMFYR